MRLASSLCLLLACSGFSVSAQVPVDSMGPLPEIRDLESIVVSGVQPGPGMWKVTRGGNTMWILGIESPLPKNMQWQSREVEAVLAQATEVLEQPGVSVNSQIGFFGKLALVPSLLQVRNSPDDTRLDELVPPHDYARWQVLKARYIGRSGRIEKWRPLFAAMKLREEAIDKSGLTSRGIVSPVIESAIKRHKPTVTRPLLKIDVPEPKRVVKAFLAESLSDQECFGETMQHLEGDVVKMVARANAWAIGDIAALRELPLSGRGNACIQAALGAEVVRKHGPADIDAATRALWLEAAELAIGRNRVTFATLPISDMLKDEGLLASFTAKGYLVEAP